MGGVGVASLGVHIEMSKELFFRAETFKYFFRSVQVLLPKEY